jgi:glutathione S-transferase
MHLGATGDAFPQPPLTLYDLPVSNNGARVRLVVYWKGLQDQVAVRSPMELGGLKTEEYLAINPQGKMPALVLPDGTSLAESEVISQYLIDKYADRGPSLTAPTPELRALATVVTRLHDIYITTIQGAMYKAMDAADRHKQLQEIYKQIGIIEDLIQGPFVIGTEKTAADAALFPTFIFMDFMLPQYFGWTDVFAGLPKLKQWYATLSQDPAGAQVRAEIEGGLNAWKEKGRWDNLGITEQVKSSGLNFAPPFN